MSEVWSNWACVQTQAAPTQRPSLPAFSVKFLGTQILNNPAKAAPGEKEEIIPQTMEITYPPNDNYIGCTTRIIALGGASQLGEDPQRGCVARRPYDYPINPIALEVSVQACASEFCGKDL